MFVTFIFQMIHISVPDMYHYHM